MSSMAEGRAAARPPGYDGRPAPSAPLTIDPTEPASMEMVRFGPGGRALAPVLVIKPGVRVCVGGFSADVDAGTGSGGGTGGSSSAGKSVPATTRAVSTVSTISNGTIDDAGHRADPATVPPRSGSTTPDASRIGKYHGRHASAAFPHVGESA